MREGQKLNKMTSTLLSHPGFESICPNSWVLVTATIGLKTEQKIAFTTFFAEGNTIDTETVGNLKNWNLRGATSESEITPS